MFFGQAISDASHIIGSASILLNQTGQQIPFFGDIVGGSTIQCADTELGSYDQIVCEATYGECACEAVLISDHLQQLAQYVEETLGRNVNLLIPAFAVERRQIVLEYLVALFETQRLKPVNVFVDSQLAERVTRATQAPPRRI
jgi:metallo-beta-lactamase family protein